MFIMREKRHKIAQREDYRTI